MRSVKRAVSNTIVKTAAALGFSLVPEWRVYRLPEERHLRRILEHFNVDCVFDVGGNIGQYGDMLRKECGYRGLIISFEPNPVALEKLRRAAHGDPLWHIEAVALGKSAGSASFNAYAQSQFGSFHEFDNIRHAPIDMPSTKIEVPIETLEEYLPTARARHGFQRPFLKMDTQGFDLDVAMGAGDLLTEFVGLQSEVAFQKLYVGAPDYRTVIDYFEMRGFKLSRLVSNHEAHFPDLVEMDAMMVNSRYVSDDD